MTARVAFMSELVEDIEAAVSDGRWDAAVPSIDTLAEEIVEAVIDGRDGDIARLAPEVDRAYTRAVERCGLMDDRPDGRSVAVQLQTFLKVLSVACRHRRPQPAEMLVTAESGRAILEALYRAPEALSGRDLVEKTGFAAETVARRVPELRSAGLVRSWRAGRFTMNELTPLVREQMRGAFGEPAAAAEHVHAPADPPSNTVRQPIHRLMVHAPFDIKRKAREELPATGDELLAHVSEIDQMVGPMAPSYQIYCVTIDRSTGATTFEFPAPGTSGARKFFPARPDVHDIVYEAKG